MYYTCIKCVSDLANETLHSYTTTYGLPKYMKKCSEICHVTSQ